MDFLSQVSCKYSGIRCQACFPVLLPNAGCKTKRCYQFAGRLPIKIGTRKARPFPECAGAKNGFIPPNGELLGTAVQNPTLDTLLRITSVLEVDLEKIIAKARKTAAKSA
jgi:hypothetical protein